MGLLISLPINIWTKLLTKAKTCSIGMKPCSQPFSNERKPTRPNTLKHPQTHSS